MPSSWLRLAALLAALPALAGCGSVVSASETTGNQLTIYSSLPLQGPSAPIARQIEGGEKLALSQAGGRVGAFKVSYVSLDDVNPVNGQPSPGESSAAAKQAAQDTSTIAYLGDYGSEATAISLPHHERGGHPAGEPVEPLCRPDLRRRSRPGRAGPLLPERQAQLRAACSPATRPRPRRRSRLMRSLALRSVYVLDDQDPFQMPLANLVAGDAAKEGVKVAGHDSIALEAEANYSRRGRKDPRQRTRRRCSSPPGAGAGTVALWQELHSADPHLLLLGSSSLANEPVHRGLGGAGARHLPDHAAARRRASTRPRLVGVMADYAAALPRRSRALRPLRLRGDGRRARRDQARRARTATTVPT